MNTKGMNIMSQLNRYEFVGSFLRPDRLKQARKDFEAGNIKRAPRWMANHGLEWLFRITQDPKRMAKRYLVDDRKILGLAIKYRKK